MWVKWPDRGKEKDRHEEKGRKHPPVENQVPKSHRRPGGSPERKRGNQRVSIKVCTIHNLYLIHLPIATASDIEMADPDANPAAVAVAAPDLGPLTARLEGVEQTLYEQTKWVEDRLWEPLARMSEMRATLRSLSTRMNDLEAYLGLQEGAQPIVLYNGVSYSKVEKIPGGPSWIREMGIADAWEADEEAADADADHLEAEAKAPAEANAPTAERVERIVLPVASVSAPPAFTVPQISHAPPSMDTLGSAVAGCEISATATATADATSISENPAAAVATAQAPSIQVVPATPQDSQETVQHATSVAPPLPQLPVSILLADADAAAAEPTSAVSNLISLQLPDPSSQRLSPSPHPSPPPPQLRRSPRLLSPDPSGLRSRSTTPQPNPKKRVGTSEERAEAKRGRKE